MFGGIQSLGSKVSARRDQRAIRLGRKKKAKRQEMFPGISKIKGIKRKKWEDRYQLNVLVLSQKQLSLTVIYLKDGFRMHIFQQIGGIQHIFLDPRIVRFINRKQHSGYQGLRGRGVESYCLMGPEFQFEKMKKFWRWIAVMIV